MPHGAEERQGKGEGGFIELIDGAAKRISLVFQERIPQNNPRSPLSPFPFPLFPYSLLPTPYSLKLPSQRRNTSLTQQRMGGRLADMGGVVPAAIALHPFRIDHTHAKRIGLAVVFQVGEGLGGV